MLQIRFHLPSRKFGENRRTDDSTITEHRIAPYPRSSEFNIRYTRCPRGFYYMASFPEQTGRALRSAKPRQHRPRLFASACDILPTCRDREPTPGNGTILPAIPVRWNKTKHLEDRVPIPRSRRLFLNSESIERKNKKITIISITKIEIIWCRQFLPLALIRSGT